jgi:transcriptional regulator with XRE-family HTH domain
MFGTFIKELRARQRLGLREFCLEHGHDPSNWSKVEREALQPPRDEETLRNWARQLGLKPGADDWHKFFDYAAVDAGRIPDHVLKDEELMAKLPVFFRTISGNKPSRAELENLIKLLRER